MSIGLLARPLGRLTDFVHRPCARVRLGMDSSFQPTLRRYFSDEPERAIKGRKYWDNLSITEKRKHYKCRKRFVTLESIDSWQKERQTRPAVRSKPLEVQVDEQLNEKVSLWRGDITVLEIDAIVNAANNSLLGGGGVDGAIHDAAGESLRVECVELNGCDTGDAKITSGHRLPARHIIHTVGPVGRNPKRLESCYCRSLELLSGNNLRSVAFPCISTGIYGYPNEDAAHVALGVVRKWLEDQDKLEDVDRVIFCVFLPTDLEIYRRLLPVYFPSHLDEPSSDDNAGGGDPATHESVSKQPCRGADTAASTCDASGDEAPLGRPESTRSSASATLTLTEHTEATGELGERTEEQHATEARAVEEVDGSGAVKEPSRAEEEAVKETDREIMLKEPVIPALDRAVSAPARSNV